VTIGHCLGLFFPMGGNSTKCTGRKCAVIYTSGLYYMYIWAVAQGGGGSKPRTNTPFSKNQSGLLRARPDDPRPKRTFFRLCCADSKSCFPYEKLLATMKLWLSQILDFCEKMAFFGPQKAIKTDQISAKNFSP
jgi:hypothetical protein